MRIKKFLYAILFSASIQSFTIDAKAFETSFPGGEDEQNKFINMMVNAYYPPKALQENVEGIVSVSATVDNFGYLNNPQVIKSLSKECDETAISIIQSMPKRIVSPSKKADSTFVEHIIVSIPFFINPNRDKIYGLEKDELPDVKVNMQDITKFIIQNLRYPIRAAEKGIQGRVFVQYVLDENGNVKYPRIIEGVSPEINEEVIRLINSLPQYEPSTYDGISVPMYFTMPIRFRLQE